MSKKKGKQPPLKLKSALLVNRFMSLIPVASLPAAPSKPRRLLRKVGGGAACPQSLQAEKVCQLAPSPLSVHFLTYGIGRLRVKCIKSIFIYINV